MPRLWLLTRVHGICGGFYLIFNTVSKFDGYLDAGKITFILFEYQVIYDMCHVPMANKTVAIKLFGYTSDKFKEQRENLIP